MSSILTACDLALRCLLPHCRNRLPLAMFCEARDLRESAIGRAQRCTAGFSGIVR